MPRSWCDYYWLSPDRKITTMSLDICLLAVRTIETRVFEGNVTHNLGEMAAMAGVYGCIWYPEESGFKTAGEIIEPLRKGLELLKSEPEFFQKFNPPNGWETYEGLVKFVEDLLQACEENPDAVLRISR